VTTVDIIIPQWNQRAKTVTCVRSIARHAPGVRILLVDNGSEPAARVDAELRTGDLILRNRENLGFVRAVNQGLEASSAELVVIQNNDTEIFDDVYARMRRILSHEPSFGALGPVTSECGSWQAIDRIVNVWAKTSPRAKLVNAAASPSSARARDVERLREVQRRTDHAERAELAAARFADHVEPIRGMLAFFCVALTRRAIKTVGLLDPDFGLGFGDDDDYCDRLHGAGFGVGLAPGCYVRHDHRATFREHFSALEIARLQRQAMALLRRKRAARTRRS